MTGFDSPEHLTQWTHRLIDALVLDDDDAGKAQVLGVLGEIPVGRAAAGQVLDMLAFSAGKALQILVGPAVRAAGATKRPMAVPVFGDNASLETRSAGRMLTAAFNEDADMLRVHVNAVLTACDAQESPDPAVKVMGDLITVLRQLLRQLPAERPAPRDGRR